MYNIITILLELRRCGFNQPSGLNKTMELISVLLYHTIYENSIICSKNDGID